MSSNLPRCATQCLVLPGSNAEIAARFRVAFRPCKLPPLTPESRFLVLQTTTVKVYARCLRPDIEYKTLGITFQTTCREVVEALLSKYRMRHRDPNLFFLTMEVTVRRAGVRTVLVLDEEARPAALQACHPTGDSR